MEDRAAHKLKVIEERKAQFAPILEAKRLEQLQKVQEAAKLRAEQEKQRQAALEKVQAQAAAVKAQQAQQEAERKAKIAQIQREEYWKQLQAKHEAEAKEAICCFIKNRLAARKARTECLRAQARAKEELRKRCHCHPMRRFLSCKALEQLDKLTHVHQLDVLSSHESLRAFEFAVRASPFRLG